MISNLGPDIANRLIQIVRNLRNIYKTDLDPMNKSTDLKMVENGRITLTSNWGTLRDADLLSVLIKSSSDDSEINLDHLTADNCVCLMRKDSRDNSKAEVEIKVNGCIKKVILLSEAQIIEVFGVNDEYLSTHNSDFLDDWEGMVVYYSEICIPNIPVCKLKFTRIKKEDTLWIYGAKIQVHHKINYMESSINFNLEQINRLLGNSALTNISSSNNFKYVLQSYFKNLPNNLGYLLGKKHSPNVIQIDTSNMENESNPENCITEKLSRLQVSEPGSAESQKTNSKTISSNDSWLTSYIDYKLNEIKCEVLKEIDGKINNLREETNHKLEKIIYLLETKKTETQNMM